ncbi:hypothetical protein [Clostridium sp. Marseille-QA1073]
MKYEHYKYTSVMVESSGSIKTSYLKNKHICKFNKGKYLEIFSSELRTRPQCSPKRTGTS